MKTSYTLKKNIYAFLLDSVLYLCIRSIELVLLCCVGPLFPSVQFSHSVVSNYLRPHELQHTRLPCPSPTPRTCSNSCPSSQWWHPTISSSVIPFFSCLQYFPTSESLLMSQFFTSGGLIIGVLASASVLPMNIQDWFPLRLTGLNLLAVQKTLKSLLQHHSSKV